MMELKQTVEMMNSADYKERFKAEYMQVVIRYKKLANMLEKWDKGEISDSEYYSKSPYGYEFWSCGYCGKWTGNFKYN